MSRPTSADRGATSLMFCTAAAHLAARLSFASLRRSGAFVLDTGLRWGSRFVLTVPGDAYGDEPPALDVFDDIGFARSHELDVPGARLIFTVLARGRSKNLVRIKKKLVLVDDALNALARWHDARVGRAQRLLFVASSADAEVTQADRRAGGDSTTALSSAG